jgi:trk system potassium uptake protein TrkH
MNVNKRIVESYRIVFGYIGVIMMIIAGILLLPLLVLLAYPEEMEHAVHFAVPAAAALILGLLLSLLLRGQNDGQLTQRQDAIIVLGVWIAAVVLSAAPFMLAKQLNFTQAIFEAISGWTTTGLSVVDVTVTPKVFLLHRSIMQFFGGVGIVLVMLSALSGTYGMRLYCAEGHADKLLPNLAKSARLILSIYAGYVLAGTLLYVAFDMPLFDAINHSIAALSTGGFSTKTDSIGAYKSLPIELTTIILMLLGTTNFAAHLLLLRGNIKKFLLIGEIRFMLILLAFSIPLVAFVSLSGLYGNAPQGIRVAAFELVSALTTTGFSTVSYSDWPPFAIFVMILLMLVGGGTGSTAGGLKQNRIYLMGKAFYWNLTKNFQPEHVVRERYIYRPEGRVYIADKQLTETFNFAFLYMVLYFVGVAILLAHGYPLQDSLFEFASAIGTVGLSVGLTAADAPPLVLWTESIGMFIGRLEIYVFFVAVIKLYKDAKHSLER